MYQTNGLLPRESGYQTKPNGDGNSSIGAGTGNDVAIAIDSFKNLKIENGINFSVLNGAPFSNLSNFNNNNQPEPSLDIHESDIQPNGNNNNRKASLNGSIHGSIHDAINNGLRGTSIDQMIDSFSLRNENGLVETANSFGSKIDETSTNKFAGRRRSRVDENGSIREKISDIYVNRNVEQMYGNGVGGQSNRDFAVVDRGFQNKGFYLHNNAVNGELNGANIGESRVYNIFSKQPGESGKGQSADVKENGYLAVKMPSGVAQGRPTPFESSRNKSDDKWNTFEDDELAKILG